MSCLSNTFAIDPPGCGAKMGGIRALLWATGGSAPSLNLSTGSDYLVDVSGSFQRIPGRGSFQCTAQVNEAEGGLYYRSEFAFNPSEYRAGEDPLAYLLAAFSEMGDEDITVLAEDWTGTLHVMGWGPMRLSDTVATRFPLFLSAGDENTGTEHTDRTGWALTLASTHPLPAGTANPSDITIVNPSND